MPYLPNYKHDIFVSYAHGPEIKGFGGEDPHPVDRWSLKFVDDLASLVSTRLGTKDIARQFSPWMDPNLGGNQPLTDAIKQTVAESALLLVIVSPYYLDSRWCREELAWFCSTSGSRPSPKERIFVVRAWLTEETEWPRGLRDCASHPLTGYSFLPRNADTGDPPHGFPCRTDDDREYWRALERLAKEVANRLKRAEAEECRKAPPLPWPAERTRAAGRNVFLGYMDDTLDAERAALRKQLTASGLNVLPTETGEEEEIDWPSLQSSFEASLRQTDALTLIANQYPGFWPKNQEGGLLGYQMQKAKEFGVPCYLWLKLDDLTVIKREKYRHYLETLAQQASDADLVLRHDGVESFATHIEKSLSASAQPDAGVEQLAVICSNLPQDEDLGRNFRDVIREAVRDTKREIFIFDFAGSEETVKLRELETRIQDADTVLVICFDQQWDWARHFIHELVRLGDPRAAPKAKLFVAGPRDRHAGLYDPGMFGFKTVDGVNIGGDRLKQMLKQEILTVAQLRQGSSIIQPGTPLA